MIALRPSVSLPHIRFKDFFVSIAFLQKLLNFVFQGFFEILHHQCVA